MADGDEEEDDKEGNGYRYVTTVVVVVVTVVVVFVFVDDNDARHAILKVRIKMNSVLSTGYASTLGNGRGEEEDRLPCSSCTRQTSLNRPLEKRRAPYTAAAERRLRSPIIVLKRVSRRLHGRVFFIL